MSDYICSGCHRTFVLHSDQRCCAFCGQRVVKQPHRDLLKTCLDCPASPQTDGKPGSWVYPHEFQHCPRCGQKLLTLEDQAADWEFSTGQRGVYGDFRDELLKGMGIPLDEFDFADDVRKRYGKPQG